VDPSVGIVLSGGGARGAYEAGLVAGIVEALGRGPQDSPPFRVLAGTSVGAINAAYLAAHTDRGDQNVGGLVRLWQSLDLTRHLQVRLRGLLGAHDLAGSLRARLPSFLPGSRRGLPEHLGRSLLDPGTLEELISRGIPWDRLHHNAATGNLGALLVAALHIGSGVTTVFAELSPGTDFRPTRNPRRVARREPITAEHILASAAIPFLFPARRVGASYYCDGGLRFNTPIASAIRAGAERLVVVSVQHRDVSARAQAVDPLLQDESTLDESALEQYPGLFFLAGKVLDALLLDPIAYDIQLLDRLNGLWRALERSLAPADLDQVQRLLIEQRGVPYRKIERLVFTPTQDIGELAGEHVLEHMSSWRIGVVPRLLLGRAARSGNSLESDWASYLLFDGAFARKLIELGRRYALARADEVRAFFAPPGDPHAPG
jgi:NTE family protein